MQSGLNLRPRWAGRKALAVALFATFADAALPPIALANDAQQIVVTLDKAKILKMPDHVETVVVGSPIIADVTMLKRNGLVVVTGKGFGETNIIFLDGAGQAVSEAMVTVQRPTNLITVQRGSDRESYSCNPRCEPSLSLGDAPKFLQETSSQITVRNGLASTKTGQP